jgi:hypothetical protein
MKAALLTEDSDARMATIYQVDQWSDRPLRRARRATKEELKAALRKLRERFAAKDRVAK